MTEHIQINAVSPRVAYVADGVQAAFTYPFAIFRAEDLEVWLDDVRQPAGYTVSGAGISAGGAVLFAVPPASGRRVTLWRRLALARTADYQADGLIRAKTLNDEFDFQVAALQQLAEDVGRAVRRAPTSGSLADLTLPEPAAGRGLKWNAAGTALVNTDHDPDLIGDAVAAATTAIAAAATANAARDEAVMAAGGVKVTVTDQTIAPLADKLVAGAGIALSPGGEGGQQLTIAATVTIPDAIFQRLDFLERNLAVNTLRDQIDAGWSLLRMVDGIADEFEDFGGIAGGNVYQLVDRTAGTAVNRANWPNAAQAFDGNYASGTGASGTGSLYIAAMKDWGAGVSRKVHKVVIHPDATYGFSSDPTAKTGIRAYFGSGLAFQWSYAAATESGQPNTQPITIEADFNLGADRYHWIDLYEGTSSGASHQLTIAEIEFHELVGAYTAPPRYDAVGDFFTNQPHPGLVPPLKINADQGWTIASSATNATYPNTINPFLLFDGADASQHYSAGTTCTWTIDSPAPIQVLAYEFRFAPYLSRMPKTWTFDGWNGSSWVTLDIRSNVTDWDVSGSGVRSRRFTCATPGGSYSRHRLNVTANNGDVQHIEFNQLRLFDTASPVMLDFVLQSVAMTAEAVPSEVRLVLLHQSIAATGLNSDCSVEASRDGGVTWTAGTLTRDGAFDAVTDIVSAMVNLSAQPAGTAMRWRFKTFNGKEQRLHGVWMQWR